MPIVEEQVIGDDAGVAGARYVKIYVSPASGNHILDIMLLNGLRLQMTIEYGQAGSIIESALISSLQKYRPTSWVDSSENVKFIARCISSVLARGGVLQPYAVGSGDFYTRWVLLRLRQILRNSRVDYEDAVETLERYYATPEQELCEEPLESCPR